LASWLPSIAIVLLSANSLYLGIRVSDEISICKARRDRFAYLPRDSSLNGIASDGKVISPAVAANGRLEGEGFLLLFVIDVGKGTEEIEYWNKVIETVAAARPQGGRPIYYWGICNAGNACNQYQRLANFTIVAFLDLYQMHVVANTIQAHGALLYDRAMILRSHIPSSNEPSLQASLIVKHLRG
jgi:hypothetical protein